MYKIYLRDTTKLMNKTEELNKRGDIPCSWIGKLNIIKMSFFPIWFIDSMQSRRKSQQAILWVWKIDSKVYVEKQRPRIANNILKEKNKVGVLALPEFKTYYNAVVTNTVWCLQNNRQIHQWNRIEGPEIGHHKYSQLIFDRVAEITQCSKDSLFNKWCVNNWTSTCKKKKKHSRETLQSSQELTQNRS